MSTTTDRRRMILDADHARVICEAGRDRLNDKLAALGMSQHVATVRKGRQTWDETFYQTATDAKTTAGILARNRGGSLVAVRSI